MRTKSNALIEHAIGVAYPHAGEWWRTKDSKRVVLVLDVGADGVLVEGRRSSAISWETFRANYREIEKKRHRWEKLDGVGAYCDACGAWKGIRLGNEIKPIFFIDIDAVETDGPQPFRCPPLGMNSSPRGVDGSRYFKSFAEPPCNVPMQRVMWSLCSTTDDPPRGLAPAWFAGLV